MGRDGYTGLAVLAAGLAFFWATLGLERHAMVPVGPGFYPRIVVGVVMALALALVVTDVRRVVVPAKAGTPSPNYGLVVLCFGIFAAYVVLLPYLGFRLASFLFLLAMPVALERPATRRRWIIVVVLAVAATFVAHLVFERYLHVLLPRGRWTGF